MYYLPTHGWHYKHCPTVAAIFVAEDKKSCFFLWQAGHQNHPVIGVRSALAAIVVPCKDD